MAKYVDMEARFEELKHLYLPSAERVFGTVKMNEIFMQADVSYFCTGHGISYCELEATFNEDTLARGKEGESYDYFYFNPLNSMSYKEQGSKQNYLLGQNCFAVGSITEGAKLEGEYLKNQTYRCQSLMIKKGIAKLKTQDDGRFTAKICKIDPQRAMLLKQIRSHIYLSNDLGMLFLESKILELTYKTFGEQSDDTDIQSISDEDKKALKMARSILLSDITNPPSIKELARKSSINEFKLKSGFKQLFGATVYATLLEHRLENAKIYLQTNDISVQEAAKLVGYKSVSHFCKAFKQKYRISPLKATKTEG